VEDALHPDKVQEEERLGADWEALAQAHCNALAGACLAVGLKYAGTHDEQAREVLTDYLHNLLLAKVKGTNSSPSGSGAGLSSSPLPLPFLGAWAGPCCCGWSLGGVHVRKMWVCFRHVVQREGGGGAGRDREGRGECRDGAPRVECAIVAV
jgi:Proteasome/cyclosome repeat